MIKRVAVIGFGFMGFTHALNVLKNKSLKLVAIVDKDKNAVEKKLNSNDGNIATGEINPDKIRNIKQYNSFDDCLKLEKLDAVHVCVHTDLHYELIRKALDNGIHVLVEKPFVFDETKGEELINLAKRNNLLLMVAHVVRFMPPYQKLKKWVDDKTYGDLKFLSLTRFSGVPKWGQWIEKQNSFGSSGGALFDLVLHDIDFATFITGQSPEKVNSTILPGYLSKHDYVNANWQFAGSNLLVKVEGGNLFHSPFPFQAGFMAQFENASVYFSTLNSEFIFVAFDDKTEEVAAGDLNDGYCNEISYFYDCIENGKQPKECMPESSLETIRVCFKHI